MLEYRTALLTAGATFILLLVGGTVNPTGSSLACAEPTLTCNGQLFPPMVGGVLYEHGHRLVAITVGLLQIALTLLLWVRRRELRFLAVTALVMVCFQGALGAITVSYKLPTAVSLSHLIVAFCYLSLLLYLAWRTRPRTGRRPSAPPELARVRPWIGVTLAALFVQIVLGGLVRHTGAALACLDLPLCYGYLMPPAPPAPLALHMLHRVGAIVVAAIILVAAVAVGRAGREWPGLRRLAWAAPMVVVVQIALGAATILSFRLPLVAVAHFAGAVALWTLWVSMWLMTHPVSPRLGEEPLAAVPAPQVGALVGEGVAT